jgi:hypothetical protein
MARKRRADDRPIAESTHTAQHPVAGTHATPGNGELPPPGI